MDNDKAEMANPQAAEPAAETSAQAEPQSESVEELKAQLAKVTTALKDVNKESAARRKRLEELETAEKQREEQKLSEMDKLTKRLQEAENELKAHKVTAMRRDIAEKVGLPAALASRLAGETPEEMEADAKALLESLPKPQKPAPGIQPTNPPDASIQKTYEQIKAEQIGQDIDIFDPAFVRKHGGGVLFTERE